MTDSISLIDFKELSSNILGEELEKLVRLLGSRKGLLPAWSGRGADQGCDLTFTDQLLGTLSSQKVTWLVSCKDKAKSGDAVYESDLPSPGILDKVNQHKADGFLLVTTTTVGTAAKKLIDSLDRSNGGPIFTLVWDSSELSQMLLELPNQDLLLQFLPKSYARVKGLTSVEGAVLAFQDQLPSEVISEVIRIIKPFSDTPLRGNLIWPYDLPTAVIIDNIITHIVLEHDIAAAIEATNKIAYDAFVVLVNKLTEKYYEECREYLFAIVQHHPKSDIRFNAAQLLFDGYEPNAVEGMDIALHLDSNVLSELYSGEVAHFVVDELYSNLNNYILYQSLDELSSKTLVELVHIESLSITSNTKERKICFSGTLTIEVTCIYDKETVSEYSFPGAFIGYFNEVGMFLEEATCNTNSYFGYDEDKKALQ